MRRVLAWRDDLNLYTTGGSNVTTYLPEPLVVGPQNLADWNRFWGPPGGDAIEGRIRYQGGNLLTRLRTAPEKLTPDDFRLRPDSRLSGRQGWQRFGCRRGLSRPRRGL